jgi:hypothetical protein
MKKGLVVLSMVMAAGAPLLAAAVTTFVPTSLPGGFPVPTIPEEVDLYKTIINILYFIFAVLLAVAAIFIIWAAFLYLTSGGDEEKLQKAKNYLVYAIVAVVIALAGRGLLQIATTLLITTL